MKTLLRLDDDEPGFSISVFIVSDDGKYRYDGFNFENPNMTIQQLAHSVRERLAIAGKLQAEING